MTLRLPHGLFDGDGSCHRDVELRPLVGQDELRLAERAPGRAWVDTLLAAAVGRLGDFDEVDHLVAGSLTRGDRQFLTLRIWAQEYGDRVAMVVRCPNPACHARADLDVTLSELAPEGSAPARPDFPVETPLGTFRVREPTGWMDAALATAQSRSQRAAELWSWLVTADPSGASLSPAAWTALPAAVRYALALGLAAESRAPDLLFVTACPSCAALLELGMEPTALFQRGQGGRRPAAADDTRLFAEIHCLAWYYHWSQAEILSLTRSQRWRYLELVRRQVEGRPLLDGRS